MARGETIVYNFRVERSEKIFQMATLPLTWSATAASCTAASWSRSTPLPALRATASCSCSTSSPWPLPALRAAAMGDTSIHHGGLELATGDAVVGAFERLGGVEVMGEDGDGGPDGVEVVRESHGIDPDAVVVGLYMGGEGSMAQLERPASATHCMTARPAGPPPMMASRQAWSGRGRSGGG